MPALASCRRKTDVTAADNGKLGALERMSICPGWRHLLP